jgi:Predicted acetyltransferase
VSEPAVSGPAVSLRDATAEDAGFLFTVYAATRAEELARVPWSAEQKDAFLRQQFDAQDRWYREHYADASYLVVLADAVPVGRLYLARRTHEIRVIDVALLAAHRGRGIGGRLLRDVMREAAETNRQVLLHVEIFNGAARRLYERLGFRPLGEPVGVHQCMEWRATSDVASAGVAGRREG